MKQLDTIHHLVHVGFMPKEYPQVEHAIITRIQDIADKTRDLVNFVDEPLFSPEEAELAQIELLADTLAHFISANYVMSLGFPWVTPEHIYIGEGDNPREVIDYLFEILDGTWQDLRDPKKGHEYVHTLRCKLKETDFVGILEKLRLHFKGKNVYGLKSSEEMQSILPDNPERRERIMEYAKKMVGGDRIIISGMGNADYTKLTPYDPNYVISTKIEVWEQMHGSASEMVLRLIAERAQKRTIRMGKDLFMKIHDKGFFIGDNTKHIIGGENYGKCTHTYGEFLKMYGLQEKNIRVDKTISLVKDYK